MSTPFVTEEPYQLDTGELDWVTRTVRNQNRLIFTIMLKFFQMQQIMLCCGPIQYQLSNPF